MHKLFHRRNKPGIQQVISQDILLKGVRNEFTSILRRNVYESSFNQEEAEQRLNFKKKLRKALRECAYGDKHAKLFVKDYIKDILLNTYQIDREKIELIIPFEKQTLLSAQDKFEIILYFYSRDYQTMALDTFIQEFQLDKPKQNKNQQNYYEITTKDIDIAYTKKSFFLSFNDKLNILVQRIYQLYKGNGVIDEIRDMKIDGVSAGVSGIPKDFELDLTNNIKLPASYDSIWLFYRGKSIYLSFLSFQTNKELIRVCKNIYRYNNPGQLSEVTGYTVNEMKDGSRVAVARPPFCEGWVFFVRKFDTILQADITKLLIDKNSELPIYLMKWLIKGEQIIAITGEQGSGKTTLLMSLIRYINPTYNLRVQELSFELHLRKIYPERNIVTFRETVSIKGQDGLDFSKKTDGTVSILGEVATAPVSAWLIQMSQMASLFTLFTHHAKTTQDLISAMRNALLQEAGFHNEKIATEQVVNCINFDIHMKKRADGHRFIERITEIIPIKHSLFQKVYNEEHKNDRVIKEFPYEKIIQPKQVSKQLFETKDIIIMENGEYKIVNLISEYNIRKICANLEKGEKEIFLEICQNWRDIDG